jgi:hypothetical protein
MVISAQVEKSVCSDKSRNQLSLLLAIAPSLQIVAVACGHNAGLFEHARGDDVR